MAPGVAVPVTVVSKDFGLLISGCADVSTGAFCVAVAVIVALSAVIAVPGATDQVGFSYPSFAVTSGYLSAGNAVPSFTSYTLLFMINQKMLARF